MSKSPKPKKIIDAKGFRCPIPALRLSKFMSDIDKGDVLALEATDQKSLEDIPLLCQEKNWTYIECIKHKEVLLHLVQK